MLKIEAMPYVLIGYRLILWLPLSKNDPDQEIKAFRAGQGIAVLYMLLFCLL